MSRVASLAPATWQIAAVMPSSTLLLTVSLAQTAVTVTLVVALRG